MQKSLNYAIQSEDSVCIGCAFSGLGEIHQAKGEELLARQSFEKAKLAFEAANDTIAIQNLQRFL